MIWAFLILIAVIGIGFVTVFWFLARMRRAAEMSRDDTGMQNMFLMMQNQIQELSRLVDTKINDQLLLRHIVVIHI